MHPTVDDTPTTGPLRDLGRAWLDDEGTREARPWQAIALLATYGDGDKDRTSYCFDGTEIRAVALHDDDPALSWDTLDRIREHTTTDDGRPWTTMLLLYTARDDRLTHEFAYGDDHPEWNILANRDDLATFATLRPRLADHLDAGVSARAAFSVAARHAKNNGVRTSLHLTGHRADRLTHGWRVYMPVDPDRPAPLTTIDDATENTVFLVGDDKRATHTSAPVETHDHILASLDPTA